MESRVCSFVPAWLLARVATTSGHAAECCQQSLESDAAFRLRRSSAAGLGAQAVAPRVAGPDWVIHDAGGETELPGRPVRTAGEPAVGDAAVDEAADGIAASLRLLAEAFGRDSFDDAGATVLATVHYGVDYVNAFWDGTQLVFGDGDGEVFARFTASVDVLGHELAHAVTDRTAGLIYQGQSGALNESVSDVFAACLVQWLRDQSADEADWLIGADLFLPGVSARGLRDMREPGTAFDDPRLGQDPQPAHMRDFVDTADDNGGVHINSGIPNRAFVLAATGIGGRSWEGAGPIWFAALTGGGVRPDTDFAGFAAATVAAAGPHADVVRRAWDDVGVTPGPLPTDTTPAGPGAGADDGVVRVTRSGGFAGQVRQGAVDLGSDDPRAADARALAQRIEPASVRAGLPRPDMFVYRFELADGRTLEVPEQELTGDLRALASLVLEPGASSL